MGIGAGYSESLGKRLLNSVIIIDERTILRFYFFNQLTSHNVTLSGER